MGTLKTEIGNPVGSTTHLKKKNLNKFFIHLLQFIFPYRKHSQNFPRDRKITVNTYWSMKVENPLIFSKLENHYQFFRNLPFLEIIVLTNNTTNHELYFLLK